MTAFSKFNDLLPAERTPSSGNPPIFKLDPLNDERWSELVARSPQSSIFHTREWLQALHDSFGYEPIVLTLSASPEPLRNGIPFCYVRSWITGSRLVSVPFSDHCEPLGSPSEVQELFSSLSSVAQETAGAGYIEVRPVSDYVPTHFHEADMFLLHRLDLRASREELFQRFHKSSIRRNIRRGEREGLEYTQGSSTWHLAEFYRLFVLTRQRLRLPPHPLQWFKSLNSRLGDKIKIELAVYRGRAVAGMITLHHKGVATYKYGGSDATFHRLGSVPFLFWAAICAARDAGAQEFDFGRSDLDSTGLITFKNHWTATATSLIYWRCGRHSEHNWEKRRQMGLAKHILGRLPKPVLVGLGAMLYRHIG